MLGERVPAEQALDWGLINRVVPDDGARVRGAALCSSGSPTARPRSYAGSKQLLNRRLYADLAGQLEAEAEAQKGQGQSKDFIEGVVAFVEKREPNFTGT